MLITFQELVQFIALSKITLLLTHNKEPVFLHVVQLISQLIRLEDAAKLATKDNLQTYYWENAWLNALLILFIMEIEFKNNVSFNVPRIHTEILWPKNVFSIHLWREYRTVPRATLLMIRLDYASRNAPWNKTFTEIHFLVNASHLVLIRTIIKTTQLCYVLLNAQAIQATLPIRWLNFVCHFALSKDGPRMYQEYVSRIALRILSLKIQLGGVWVNV